VPEPGIHKARVTFLGKPHPIEAGTSSPDALSNLGGHFIIKKAYVLVSVSRKSYTYSAGIRPNQPAIVGTRKGDISLKERS